MSLLIQAASYVGDYAVGDTVRFKFNATDVTGALATITGAVVSVYKDDGTTESTAGVTLAAAFDSRTGLYAVTIDTSADGTFYSKGSEFEVVLTTGAIGAVSVIGTVVGHFSLANRTLADGKAHGGTLGSSTATLALKQANVTADPGDLNAVALNLVSNGTGGIAFRLAADLCGLRTSINSASGYSMILSGPEAGVTVGGLLGGLVLSGGPDTPGLRVEGGYTSGPAVLVLTEDGNGVTISPTGGHGISITANGAGKHDISLAGSGDIQGTLTGTVLANVKKVNDVTVTGTGASGSEWGP